MFTYIHYTCKSASVCKNAHAFKPSILCTHDSLKRDPQDKLKIYEPRSAKTGSANDMGYHGTFYGLF